ncbi:MAG: hypothetical protein WAT79_07435 [Saprospiraceae bacterium]
MSQDSVIDIKEDWSIFEMMEGKNPSDIGLITLPGLQARIKSLLKKEYDSFQNDWNEETPLIVEDRILFFSGCQRGDCKANKYVVILDVVDNNINIINFKYGSVKSWEERSIIGLSSSLLEHFEKVRVEQGL